MVKVGINTEHIISQLTQHDCNQSSSLTNSLREIEIANEGLQGPQKRDDDWTEKNSGQGKRAETAEQIEIRQLRKRQQQRTRREFEDKQVKLI